MTASGLYVGRVMHRRLRPKMHQLSYRTFSLLLDLDEIDELDRSLRFFSRGKFNLLSFHDSGHGDGSDVPLRQQVKTHLWKAGITSVGRIRLLAMPRLFGFVFNPLSIYFCDRPDGRAAAILYEVNNTFGERHTYVLPIDGHEEIVRQTVSKAFHVSPFLPMAMSYAFRVKQPAEDVRVGITVSDSSGPVLAAIQRASRRPLTDREILRAVVTHPLMTLKVIAGIGWEALKLLLKGVRVHRHPTPPEASITIGNRARNLAITSRQSPTCTSPPRPRVASQAPRARPSSC